MPCLVAWGELTSSSTYRTTTRNIYIETVRWDDLSALQGTTRDKWVFLPATFIGIDWYVLVNISRSSDNWRLLSCSTKVLHLSLYKIPFSTFFLWFSTLKFLVTWIKKSVIPDWKSFQVAENCFGTEKGIFRWHTFDELVIVWHVCDQYFYLVLFSSQAIYVYVSQISKRNEVEYFKKNFYLFEFRTICHFQLTSRTEIS